MSYSSLIPLVSSLFSICLPVSLMFPIRHDFHSFTVPPPQTLLLILLHMVCLFNGIPGQGPMKGTHFTFLFCLSLQLPWLVLSLRQGFTLLPKLAFNSRQSSCLSLSLARIMSMSQPQHPAISLNARTSNRRGLPNGQGHIAGFPSGRQTSDPASLL